jgi:hypothetical protein
LLKHSTESDLKRRFIGWRFTGREVRSLLALQPLAQHHDFDGFAERLDQAVLTCPDDYPPVLRPRHPDAALDTKQLQYRALLKGKRVALVGPSQSVVGLRQGTRLESFDLVVRVNFQWPVPPALVSDIGRRMDILYHCCNGDVPIERLFRDGFEATRFVCWQFGIDSHKLESHCSKVGVPHLDVSPVFDELLRKMHAFPTTGTVALHDLLSHDVDCVYVTGMTFFRDPHYDGYLTGGGRSGDEYRRGDSGTVGIHDVSAQFELVRHLKAADPRLEVDATLEALLAVETGSPSPLESRRQREGS